MEKKIKLLVSVSRLSEAISIHNCGVDIIDIKNPKEGSLGANFPWVVMQVRKKLGKNSKLSATIGDFPNLPGTASFAALGAAYCGADYIKVGLYGPKNYKEASFFMRNIVRSIRDLKFKSKVIASGYADYAFFNGLNPLLLPKIAHESRADGVLIDIKNKDHRSLFDFIKLSNIRKFVNNCHNRGLLAALAGGLSKKDIDLIREIGADVIGVRRSVYSNFNNKISGVNKILVKEFVKEIRSH